MSIGVYVAYTCHELARAYTSLGGSGLLCVSLPSRNCSVHHRDCHYAAPLLCAIPHTSATEMCHTNAM